MSAFPAIFDLSNLIDTNGGDGSDGFILNGVNTNDLSGYIVSTAGDLNADGIDDIIVGLSTDVGTTEGYVVFGSSTNFGTSIDLSSLNTSGKPSGLVLIGDGITGFGDNTAVSAAGDINGDGIDDLIIGKSGDSASATYSAGQSYVIFGDDDGFENPSIALTNLDGTNGGFIISGSDDFEASGFSVSNAGDVNGDGIDDLIIGAPYAELDSDYSIGRSYIVFGDDFNSNLNLSSLDGTNGFELNGVITNENSDLLGFAVSSAGDINNDGKDDLIVSANRAAPPDGVGLNKTDAGETYIVFGTDIPFTNGQASLADLNNSGGPNGFILEGSNPFDLSGFSVSGAGNINGDGFDDLLIGVPYALDPNTYENASKVYVVFGDSSFANTRYDLATVGTMNGLDGFVIESLTADDSLGVAVSNAGDINGDGMDDIIIGNRDANYGAGEGYIIYGSDAEFPSSLDLTTLDGSNGLVLNGIDADDSAGFSVSNAGDVNGDGIDDLIIGARYADPNGISSAGESYIVFGRPEITNNTPTVNNDTLIGTTASDTLNALDGNDILLGKEGSDTLEGGSGEDTISGGNDDDLITGSNGNDLLNGNGGADTISGGNGEDTLFGNNGDDNLNGGSGNDTLTGGSGNDSLKGGRDADIIYGNDGDDTLVGASGIDTIFGENGTDFLVGNDGDDSLEGGSGDDQLFGSNNNDILRGEEGNDFLKGGRDNDFLYGGDDNDELVGAAGADTLFGEEGADTLLGNSEEDTLDGGIGNDTIFGGDDADLLMGGEGNDSLHGGRGSDTLNGGNESDILDGREDNDTLNGEDGNDILIGNLGLDTLNGGSGSDTLYGNEDNDRLEGGLDDDFLHGGSGDDELIGDAGADMLFGEDGADNLFGNDGEDILEGGLGNDTLFGNDDNDILNGDDNEDTLNGGNGNDTLKGGNDNDLLNGDGGNDTLFGDSGNDTLFGNDGLDNLNGGSGSDTLYGNDGNDSLKGAQDNDVLYGGAGDDNLVGAAGNDSLEGNDGDDMLLGDSGTDRLEGGEGNDFLSGGEGNDVLIGGVLGTTGSTAQIDTLSDNRGNDVYVVQDMYGGFGDNDYVLIKTFNDADGDTIGLGDDTYTLADTAAGAGIYDSSSDLLAVITGYTAGALNINAAYFVYNYT